MLKSSMPNSQLSTTPPPQHNPSVFQQSWAPVMAAYSSPLSRKLTAILKSHVQAACRLIFQNPLCSTTTCTPHYLHNPSILQYLWHPIIAGYNNVWLWFWFCLFNNIYHYHTAHLCCCLSNCLHLSTANSLSACTSYLILCPLMLHLISHLTCHDQGSQEGE